MNFTIQIKIGKSTYYLPSELFETFLSTQSDGLSTQAGGLSTQVENFSAPRKFEKSPKILIDKIEKLGKHTTDPKQIGEIMLKCAKCTPFLFLS